MATPRNRPTARTKPKARITPEDRRAAILKYLQNGGSLQTGRTTVTAAKRRPPASL